MSEFLWWMRWTDPLWASRELTVEGVEQQMEEEVVVLVIQEVVVEIQLMSEFIELIELLFKVLSIMLSFN